MTTTSASPRSSAGPDTHGPITASTVGTTPDASASAWATRPRRAATRRPRRRRRPTTRSCRRPGRRARSRAGWRARSPAPSGGPIAPTCLPPSMRNQLTVRPSISRELRGGGVAAVRRRAASAPRRAQPLAVSTKRRVVAAEPERVREHGSRSDLTRPRRPRRRVRCRRRSARGWRSAGTTPSRIDSSEMTASAAPAPPIMWPSTPLRRRDGRRVVAEHLADRLGLGGVVERRRGAVRVDVPDVGRRRGRRRRGRAACTCAAPAPPGDGAVMW